MKKYLIEGSGFKYLFNADVQLNDYSSKISHLIFMYILLSYLASYEAVCFSSGYSKGLKTVGVFFPCRSAVSKKSMIQLIVVSLITSMCLARFQSRLIRHLLAQNHVSVLSFFCIGYRDLMILPTPKSQLPLEQ